MLGAGSHVPQKKHGYRNHFAATIGGQEHGIMLSMEAAGLVSRGRTINGGGMEYFHATVDGCKAIGLGKAAIKRAFED